MNWNNYFVRQIAIQRTDFQHGAPWVSDCLTCECVEILHVFYARLWTSDLIHLTATWPTLHEHLWAASSGLLHVKCLAVSLLRGERPFAVTNQDSLPHLHSDTTKRRVQPQTAHAGRSLCWMQTCVTSSAELMNCIWYKSSREYMLALMLYIYEDMGSLLQESRRIKSLYWCQIFTQLKFSHCA